MKITVNFNAMVLGKKENVSPDGKQKYYKLAIFDNSSQEAGNIGCNEEIYTHVDMGNYHFSAVFDDQYKSMKVVSAMPADGSSSKK